MFHCDRWLLADKTETKIEQRRVVELFIRADQQSRPQLDDHPPELDSSRDDKTSLTESKEPHSPHVQVILSCYRQDHMFVAA